VWKAGEFRQALSGRDASLWASVFNVMDSGNYVDEASRIPTGSNILFLKNTIDELARKYNQSEDTFRSEFEAVRTVLYHERSKRQRPLKDDKILTDWNGLMIGSLALGGRVLGNRQYADAAEKAAHFILNTLRDASGNLLHRYRDGEAAIPANACDYAFLIHGFIELYHAASDPVWLDASVSLQNQMITDFWDSEHGGFFLAGFRSRDLPVLPKDMYDGAIPSANSVSLHNLLRLSKLTGNSDWNARAEQLLRIFSDPVRSNPTAYSYGLIGIDLYYSDRKNDGSGDI
jgi:uncharacterized protein YyaL (SSP411 family)